MVDTPDIDGQDVAEVFDEDNTNDEAERYGGREDAEQFEDIPDVHDVTSRVGDADDDEAEIGEDMAADELVQTAPDHDAAAGNIDGEERLVRGRHGKYAGPTLLGDLLEGRSQRTHSRRAEGYSAEDPGEENDLGPDDPDLRDGVGKTDPHEVELTYAGDLSNVEGATSSAADLESDELSDDDLRDLDYKD